MQLRVRNHLRLRLSLLLSGLLVLLLFDLVLRVVCLLVLSLLSKHHDLFSLLLRQFARLRVHLSLLLLLFQDVLVLVTIWVVRWLGVWVSGFDVRRGYNVLGWFIRLIIVTV